MQLDMAKKVFDRLELSTEGKRVMVRRLARVVWISGELACELVDLPRSSYYYRSHKADEGQLVADLKAVAGSM